MPLDDISEARLREVHPELAAKIRKMAEMLEPEGIEIRVTQSLRPWREQEALYAQGRTTPGEIVTKAEAGHSWHQFGLAVDVAPLTKQGIDWDIAHPVWGRIVDVGRALGLVSGATWRTFPDWPHFQLTGRFPVSPNDEVRTILMHGGIEAVWQAAFGFPEKQKAETLEAQADIAGINNDLNS